MLPYAFFLPLKIGSNNIIKGLAAKGYKRT